MSKAPIKVIIANGNALMGAGIKSALASGGCKVVYETESGKALLTMLKTKPQVDVLVTDISLKHINGFMLIKELSSKYPNLKVVFASPHTHKYTMSYMLHFGARGFVPADTDVKTLLKAISDVHTKGYYYSKLVPKKMVEEARENKPEVLTPRQITFLEWCCTELPYYDMATKMKLSTRTVDWYRDIMFEKFSLTNRTDLVLFCLRTGLVSL